MRQGELIQPMTKSGASDRDADIVGYREIGKSLAARWMFLSKEHRATGSVLSAPVAYAALNRAHLPDRVLAGSPSLKFLKQRRRG